MCSPEVDGRQGSAPPAEVRSKDLNLGLQKWARDIIVEKAKKQR